MSVLHRPKWECRAATADSKSPLHTEKVREACADSWEAEKVQEACAGSCEAEKVQEACDDSCEAEKNAL